MPTLSFRQKLWLPLVISLIALLLVSISSACFPTRRGWKSAATI